MKKLLSIVLTAILLELCVIPAHAAEDYSLIGDADEDGEVSILDATYVQRALAGLCELSVLTTFLGDVDGEDGLTILDATKIQRRLAGFSDDFYLDRLPHWQVSVKAVTYPPSPLAETALGSVIAFHIEEETHIIPTEYEIYVDGLLLRERSTYPDFAYYFRDAGIYRFAVIAYDPFGGSDIYRFEMTVKSAEEMTPKITSAVYNRNTHILSVVARDGAEPYQYQYIIRNNVSAPPPGEYVNASDFDFTFDENGFPILKCYFCEGSAVYIPVEQLTKTLTYTCEVQVRDANGSLSEIKYVPIRL